MINLQLLCEDLKKSESHANHEIKEIILNIFSFLNKPSVNTVKMIEGWKDEFKYIYGDVNTNLSSNNKLDPKAFLQQYGVELDNIESDSYIEAVQLLFLATQTFFSLLIKAATKAILTEDDDHSSVTDVVMGSFAERSGIIGYCDVDWYCWPIYEVKNGFDLIIERIENLLFNYKSFMNYSEFSCNNNYDFIKQMYESIIPRELRHALGEYYTPDWLAEYTLIEVINESDKPVELIRFLDPTCGSGTFLMKAIKTKRDKQCDLKTIVNSVIGIDINPLAVLTAKTNYVLSIIDLLETNDPITIPVYNADVLEMANCEMSNYDEPKQEPFNNELLKQKKEKKRQTINAINALEKVDAIIGNPPWVNWEYMPEKYRFGNQQLWVDYCLFSATGRDLSFSKEDISVLITYVVMDKLLKDGGFIGFVIRQGVFKSAQNGIGFRRFMIKDEVPIKVTRVDDLSHIKAFDNATNSTAVFFAEKGKDNDYPIPYYVWEKRKDLGRRSFNAYSELDLVLSQITIEEQMAMPAVKDDYTSIWITANKKKLEVIESVLGSNQYRARTGVFTGGANAVYWLQIVDTSSSGIIVRNITERAKRKVDQIEAEIESKFVFPMLKGSNVKKWNVSYDTYLLCPHTGETKMWPVPFEELKQSYPKTAAYLNHFKNDLDNRNGFAGWEKEIQEKEFHAILRIGDYTFSNYKVVWRYIASEFVCAVISDVDDSYLGKSMLLPNEKIMYVSLADEAEAYYLCGMLSSTVIGDCVKGYMNPTSISAHVLNKLNIPAYDSENEIHQKISQICKEGHITGTVEDNINKIDNLVALLY